MKSKLLLALLVAVMGAAVARAQVNIYDGHGKLLGSASGNLTLVTPLPTAAPTSAPTIVPTAVHTPVASPSPVPTCIKITAPLPGATVSGSSVHVSTADTCAGAWFENLYIDGTFTGSFAPGAVLFNSTTLSNAGHTLMVTSQSQNPGSVLLGAVQIGVIVSNGAATPTAIPTAVPTSVAGGPPTCADAASCAQFPLSDAQAKAYTDQYFAGQPFTQEKQTQNVPHNSMVPTATQLAAVTPSSLQNADGQRLMKLVSGACYAGGTTQQILTCAAIKWGYPPRMFWAEAVNESGWSHSSIGDIGNGVSLGSLQNKSTNYPGTCPGVSGCPSHNYGTDSDANNYALCPNLNAKNSAGNLTCLTYQYTTFGTEYAIAWQHACMVGDNTYLTGGPGGTDSKGFTFPAYHVGPGAFNDKWGCMGVWYSGQWSFGPGSVEHSLNNNMGYHVLIQNYYCCQPYDASGFLNGNGGSGIGCTGSCQLP